MMITSNQEVGSEVLVVMETSEEIEVVTSVITIDIQESNSIEVKISNKDHNSEMVKLNTTRELNRESSEVEIKTWVKVDHTLVEVVNSPENSDQ